jgi:hypothetical protein
MVHFEVGRHPQTLPKYIYLKCKCVLTLFDLPKMGEAKDSTKRAIFAHFAGHWAITPGASQHHFQSFPTLMTAKTADDGNLNAL